MVVFYAELKREKRDRSFSEVLSTHLENRRQLADVTGTGILDPETHAGVKQDIGELSERALARLDDETM